MPETVREPTVVLVHGAFAGGALALPVSPPGQVADTILAAVRG